MVGKSKQQYNIHNLQVKSQNNANRPLLFLNWKENLLPSDPSCSSGQSPQSRKLPDLNSWRLSKNLKKKGNRTSKCWIRDKKFQEVGDVGGGEGGVKLY